MNDPEDVPRLYHPEVPQSFTPKRGRAAPLAPLKKDTRFTLPFADHASPQDHAALADQEAIGAIEQTYVGLHRSQALLAYVKILDLGAPDVGDLLIEAKNLYEQALSTYDRQDFIVANELALASSDLSRAGEIMITRTLRLNSNSPSLVTPPPARRITQDDSIRFGSQVSAAEQILVRLRWLLANGTMPSEESDQVRRITSWSERYFGLARRLALNGAVQDSIELAEAAAVIARSAEHVCRQSYVAHGFAPHSASSPSAV